MHAGQRLAPFRRGFKDLDDTYLTLTDGSALDMKPDAPAHQLAGRRRSRSGRQRRHAPLGTKLIGDTAESTAWEGAKIVVSHVTPLGPTVIAGCYLARQVGYAAVGLRNGTALVLEVSIPGLDMVLGSNALPDGFGLTVHARVFSQRTGRVSEIGIEPEIQVYHQ